MMLFALLGCPAPDSGERQQLEIAWLDADGDSFGDPAAALQATAVPVGYVTNDDDCDDADPDVHPAAPEACNTRDDDCDGIADEEPVASATWYLDEDGDGVGTDSDPIEACPAPPGYAAASGDCDDANPAIAPGTVEECDDGIDQDCSGQDARCAPAGSESLANAPVKILGGEPERELGDDLHIGPDCVGVASAGLLMYQPDTSGYSHAGGIPSSWTGLSGGEVTSQALPGDGRFVTTETDTGLVVSDTAACLPGLLPSGGLVLFVSTVRNDTDDNRAIVGFPAPISDVVGLDDAPLSVLEGTGGVAALAAADTDGDGLSELIVSSDDSTETGAIFVFDTTLPVPWDTATAVAQLIPHELHDTTKMGHSLCTSDLDGDGLTDIATGNKNDPGDLNALWVDAGAVWIAYAPFSGQILLDDNSGGLDQGDGLWLGETPQDNAGWALTCGRDLTGDGLPDLLVGAHQQDEPPGMAYIVAGPASGVHSFTESDWIARAEEPEYCFGYSVTGDSDLNGDGLGDVVVGGCETERSAGATYIFYSDGGFSGTAAATDADAVWLGEEEIDNARLVAGGGDLDDDGFDDIAIGAHLQSGNGEDAGTVYVIFGGMTP